MFEEEREAILHQKNETRTKGSYVVDPQLKPEPWQVKYLEVMFDKYAEMYAVMVGHLLGIWGSQKDRTGLFSDEQFFDSWRLSFIVVLCKFVLTRPASAW